MHVLLTPNERLITISLHDEAKCSCELAADLNKTDTVISNNLKKMQTEKLVIHERTGIRKKYRLTSQGEAIYQLLVVHNDGFRDLVAEYESEKREQRSCSRF